MYGTLFSQSLARYLPYEFFPNNSARISALELRQICMISPNTMCQLFLDILKNCGFKDASSHSGRRTYITRLANKGVGVRLLAALVGHSHISTTQRYIDVNADQMREAVELL